MFVPSIILLANEFFFEEIHFFSGICVIQWQYTIVVDLLGYGTVTSAGVCGELLVVILEVSPAPISGL